MSIVIDNGKRFYKDTRGKLHSLEFTKESIHGHDVWSPIEDPHGIYAIYSIIKSIEEFENLYIKRIDDINKLMVCKFCNSIMDVSSSNTVFNCIDCKITFSYILSSLKLYSQKYEIKDDLIKVIKMLVNKTILYSKDNGPISIQEAYLDTHPKDILKLGQSILKMKSFL